ncbi:MAG: septation protein IspZ [Bdellovibrio sp.]
MFKLINFLFSNFGPIVSFYIINHFCGYKVAVLISILLVVAEYIWLKWRNQKIHFFFYFSSGVILFFGAADLLIQESCFIKYEATFTNSLFAVFFGMSLFKEKSIIQEFAETQGRTSTESTIDKSYFFKFLTAAWIVYFLAKAFFYLWLNSLLSTDEAIISRIIIGKVSFWIMMFLSVGIPKKIWSLIERLGLFPSQHSRRNNCEFEKLN